MNVGQLTNFYCLYFISPMLTAIIVLVQSIIYNRQFYRFISQVCTYTINSENQCLRAISQNLKLNSKIMYEMVVLLFCSTEF